MKLLPLLFSAVIGGIRSNNVIKNTLVLYSSVSSISSIPYNPKVLVAIANGSEEIETVTIIDTLVRSGAKVTVASVEDDLQVTCSRGVLLKANCFINNCKNEDFDCIALPGGMPGAETLKSNDILRDMVLNQNNESKYIGAICAAPAIILSTWKIIDKNCQATGYPAPQFTEKIDNYSYDDVVVHNNIVTSRGPGTSLKFALKLVELLVGKEISLKLREEMLAN